MPHHGWVRTFWRRASIARGAPDTYILTIDGRLSVPLFAVCVHEERSLASRQQWWETSVFRFQREVTLIFCSLVWRHTTAVHDIVLPLQQGISGNYDRRSRQPSAVTTRHCGHWVATGGYLWVGGFDTKQAGG